MTIEERLEIVERELAHQREMQRLRDANEDLNGARMGMLDMEVKATQRALPKLHAAIKELEEASIVTGGLQARQGGVLKDHADWLEELTRSQLKTEAHFRETDERIAKLGADTDARIDKLVSAIG